MRNQGDALAHATEKSLKELGDKIDASERARVEAALTELRDAVKGDSRSAIEAKIKALSEASSALMQKAYSAEGAGPASEGGTAGDDNVVDAEFEEVKDDDQKSA